MQLPRIEINPVSGLGPVAALLSLTLLHAWRRAAHANRKTALFDAAFDPVADYSRGSSDDGTRRVIVVTGGLGFLGAELIQQLLSEEDVAIRCFDVGRPRAKDPRVTYVRGTLESAEALKTAMAGATSCIHVAALLSPLGVEVSDLMRVNVLGTKLVLLAALQGGVRRFVATSSIAAILSRKESMGGGTQTGSEAVNPYPQSPEDFIEPYGYSKYLVEEQVLAANVPGVMETVVLRPSIIFGAKDGKLAERLIQGLDANTVGEAQQSGDFVHVSDVARAHVLAERALGAAGNALAGKPFFVGCGRSLKVKDFFDDWVPGVKAQPAPVGVVRKIAALNKAIFGLVRVAPFSAWLYPESVDMITCAYWFPTDAAKAAFGYSPKDPLLAKKEMIELYRKQR